MLYFQILIYYFINKIYYVLSKMIIFLNSNKICDNLKNKRVGKEKTKAKYFVLRN
jgi:hypothetical protein